MATSIQTLPSVSANAVTVNIPAILEKNSQLAQTVGDLLSVPSVIVTLGATSPAPITYNAAGLFTSLLQMADTTQGASGSTATAVSTANTATAGTATNAAMGNSGGTSVADLAALLGLGPTATNSDVLNALVILQGLPATTAQALATLLAPNSNPSSASGAGTLTVNQALANQLVIDLNSAITGTTTTSAFSAPDILQGLPPNSTVQSINNLLSTNLGLAAAALLNSAGTAATTTTAGNGGTLITTVAATATPTTANSTAALNNQLLANEDLTTASTVAVSTGNTGTTASTGTVSNAVPAVAAAPTAATPAETIAATPAIAAPAAATISIATPTAAAVTLEATNAVANNFLLDSVAQALANIAGNPAYANIVAGLNMSVAIFRSQQASTTALPNPTYSVQSVTVVPPVNAVAPYAGSREAA